MGLPPPVFTTDERAASAGRVGARAILVPSTFACSRESLANRTHIKGCLSDVLDLFAGKHVPSRTGGQGSRLTYTILGCLLWSFGKAPCRHSSKRREANMRMLRTSQPSSSTRRCAYSPPCCSAECLGWSTYVQGGRTLNTTGRGSLL